MRLYTNLAVLALTASAISPALAAPTAQARYGYLGLWSSGEAFLMGSISSQVMNPGASSGLKATATQALLSSAIFGLGGPLVEYIKNWWQGRQSQSQTQNSGGYSSAPGSYSSAPVSYSSAPASYSGQPPVQRAIAELVGRALGDFDLDK